MRVAMDLLEERWTALEGAVRELAAGMFPPGASVDVTVSDNGDDDWVLPLVVTVMSVDGRREGQGLCDGVSDTVLGLAGFLLGQVAEGFFGPVLTDGFGDEG